ncbi:MAG: hypothetical protein WB565_00165 [Acidimicrobiales bacterium]
MKRKYIIEQEVLDDLIARVAKAEAAAMPPPKPLHEMSTEERNAYASEVWSSVLDRPARGAR